jgi:hypothetical protein
LVRARRFDATGVPAALGLLTSTRSPLEGVATRRLFPDIVAFASPGGTTNADSFVSQGVSAEGHDVPASGLPAVAPASATRLP